MARTKQTARSAGPSQSLLQYKATQKLKKDTRIATEKWKYFEEMVLSNHIIYAGFDAPVWRLNAKNPDTAQFYTLNTQGKLIPLNTSVNRTSISHQAATDIRAPEKLAREYVKHVGNLKLELPEKATTTSLDSLQMALLQMTSLVLEQCDNQYLYRPGTLDLEVVMSATSNPRRSVIMRALNGDIDKNTGRSKAQAFNPHYPFLLETISADLYMADPFLLGPLELLVGRHRLSYALAQPDCQLMFSRIIAEAAQKVNDEAVALWLFMLFLVLGSKTRNVFMKENYVIGMGQNAQGTNLFQAITTDPVLHSAVARWAIVIRRWGWGEALRHFVGQKTFDKAKFIKNVDWTSGLYSFVPDPLESLI